MTGKFASALLFAFMFAVPAQAADKMDIIASFSILGDMVKQVAGDRAAVLTLVGPNGDAHTFDPLPSDAKKLTRAKLFFVNGLGLEPWVDRLTAASGYQGPVVVASEGIEPRTMVEEEEGSSKTITDPHAWQDLSNGVTYVSNIVDALSKADPAHAADYRSSGDKYIAELRALDAEVRKQFDSVPAEKRRVITSHDAFGYFGGTYGVEFLAPEGISTESEASAADLAKLLDQIKREHIRVIFVENVTDPRMVNMIAKETGAKVGGSLFSDALSPSDGPAPHYLDMFKNNVPKLVAAMRKN